MKEKKNKKDNYSFNGNEINYQIKRKFNSSGDMIDLEMEGKAIFSNEQNNNKEDLNGNNLDNEDYKFTNSNENFHKLGFNGYKLNVTSNLKLIENKIDKDTMKILKEIGKKYNMIIPNNTGVTEKNEKGEEIEGENNPDINITEDNLEEENNNNINDNKNERRNLASNKNFPNSYNNTYKFLNKYIKNLIV